ncbi:MAG: hypothetical protein KDC57_11380 [Saprospiraceae bacterium]|nr:hypothetical protein [Saprospiraceae bacterium]
MNIKCTFIGLLFLLIAAGHLDAQDRFRSCSAAFLNDHMVVTEYTDQGICEVSKHDHGTLTVQTAYLSPEVNKPTGKLKFRIAIQDGGTGTMWSYSDKTFKEVALEAVLEKCKAGDRIVLMTVEDDYALPHSFVYVKE